MASLKGRLAIITNGLNKRVIRGKKINKWILQVPPDTDILVKYVFELRRTCPINYWRKKVLIAYCHFNG